jgi:GNAT superfamily N-acetyltransferase
MDVTLVEVRESEYDDFFAMYEPYVRELDPYDPAGPAPAGYLDQYRRAVLDDMEGRELLWILAGGARAGLIVVRTQSDWPDESRAVASIAEFYVLPEFRRARTGTAAGLDRSGHPARQRACEGVLGEPGLRGADVPDEPETVTRS